MKKKDKIKELELQVSCLTALLAEYVVKEAISRIPIPNYSKGSTEGLAVVGDGNKKETVIKKSAFQQKLHEAMEKQKQSKEQ